MDIFWIDSWKKRLREERVVIIVQQIIPPFRLSFFRELSNRLTEPLVVLAGNASKKSSRKSILNDSQISTIKINNVYILNDNFTIQYEVLNFIRTNNVSYVVLEFNLRILSNIPILLYCLNKNIKVIWWGHGFSPKTGNVIKKIRVWLVNLVEGIILYEDNALEDMMNYGAKESKVFVAPNAINTDKIKQLVNRDNFRDRNNLLYIGRLIPGKKVNLLLLSFAKIDKKIGLTLTIVGNGTELEKLKELSKSLGIDDRVIFTGEITQEEELSNIFNASLLSISPGYVGLSILHSFSYGVPLVVAKDECHSPEICLFEDGVNGAYFESNDVYSLSRIIVGLIANLPKCEKFGSAGMKTVNDKFSIQSMTDGFLSAINLKKS